MRAMPTKPQRDHAQCLSPGVFVDREAKVLRGYVVAQAGVFKNAGRGQFDAQSLASIVSLYRKAGPSGLKSRFTHPTMSSDGLGSFLGRSKDARLDGDRVRADLHLDPTSFASPRGNLGQYVLDLAASDPDALSSSLVLLADRKPVLGGNGRPMHDEKGEEVAPLWLPTKLHASDIVETGDAVDGLLSADIDPEGLPLGALWKGSEMLNQLFAGQPREVVESRCSAWLGRYLDQRYGPNVRDRDLAVRMRLMEMRTRS